MYCENFSVPADKSKSLSRLEKAMLNGTTDMGRGWRGRPAVPSTKRKGRGVSSLVASCAALSCAKLEYDVRVW